MAKAEGIGFEPMTICYRLPFVSLSRGVQFLCCMISREFAVNVEALRTSRGSCSIQLRAPCLNSATPSEEGPAGFEPAFSFV